MTVLGPDDADLILLEKKLRRVGFLTRITGSSGRYGVGSKTMHISDRDGEEVFHITLRKTTYDKQDELYLGMEGN